MIHQRAKEHRIFDDELTAQKWLNALIDGRVFVTWNGAHETFNLSDPWRSVAPYMQMKAELAGPSWQWKENA